MTEKRINTDNPAEIDGDPAEVKATISRQLVEVVDELGAYVELAVTQLSNAERTRLLDENPKLTPEELADAYDDTELAGQLARLDGAAKVFLSLATKIAGKEAS